MVSKVVFQATAGLSVEFINFLSENNIQLWDIVYNPLGFTAVCYGEDYFFIASNSKKFQVKVRIICKKGIIFKLLKLKRRKGIIVSVLLFLLLNLVFSNIVWRININTGNIELKNNIAVWLWQQDIFTGCFYSKGKFNSAIHSIMLENQDLGYMTLNFYKGILDCNIYERTEREDYINNLTGNNIYAQKTGVITDIRVYNGYSEIQIGQSVSQGELLVSNLYTDRHGNIYSSNTRAYIEAACEEKYTIYIPYSKSIQLLSGQSEKSITLYYPGGKKEIVKADISGWDNCVKTEKLEYITISGFHIPVTAITSTWYKIEEGKISNDIASALQAGKTRIEHMIANDEKLKEELTRNYDYQADKNGISVTAVVEGIYDIT